MPSDAVWVGSGQWDNWTTNGYTIYNNIWGSGASPADDLGAVREQLGRGGQPPAHQRHQVLPERELHPQPLAELAELAQQLVQRDGAEPAATT
nr:hypothetical protein GCM10020092_075980 [Actinoplanes digitatis]